MIIHKKKNKTKELTTKNPFKVYNTIKYLARCEYENNYFPYTGLKTYIGAQGLGKTISAVVEIREKLKKHPKTVFISNVEIKGIKNEVIYYENSTQLFEIIPKILKRQNKYGYLIFIDEIQNVFENMFRNGIDGILLQLLSQQRKCHVQIISTTQMYDKMPKGIRDYLRQSGEIVQCYIPKKICSFLQILYYYKMEELAEDSKNKLKNKKIEHIEWFFHTPELYECYDTFATITMITHEIEQSIKGGQKTNDNRLLTNN